MNPRRAAQQCKDKIAIRYEAGLPWFYSLRINQLFVSVGDDLYEVHASMKGLSYRDWKPCNAQAILIFAAIEKKMKQTVSVKTDSVSLPIRQ